MRREWGRQNSAMRADLIKLLRTKVVEVLRWSATPSGVGTKSLSTTEYLGSAAFFLRAS